MNRFKTIIYMIIGGILYAASVNIFTAPNDIAPGGITGLATMLNFLTGLPIGTGILLLNIPLLIWAYKEEGKGVTLTLSATLICSASIDLTAPFMPVFKNDLFLSTMFGGILSGSGLGLILLCGATTGGSDLAASIISKKNPHISVGTLMLYIDCAVILISAFVYQNFILPMYALIMVFITGKVIDTLVYGTKSGKLVYIISENSEVITEKILNDMNRGVTQLFAKGGYSGKNLSVLLCALRRHELKRLYSIVKQNDKNAFIILSDASEIFGDGFEFM